MNVERISVAGTDVGDSQYQCGGWISFLMLHIDSLFINPHAALGDTCLLLREHTAYRCN